MQKRTREIAALLILGLLVVVVAFAMGYYILIGHNWNRAASTIDEQLGTMDGYTVIIYQGTLNREVGSTQATHAAERDAKEKAEDRERADAKRILEAAQSYREKGATVFLLDLDEPRWYRDPLIMQRGSQRIGVFSLGGRSFNVQSIVAVKELERQGADYIVAMSDDERVCKQNIPGLDVVICPGNDSISRDGQYHGLVYCLGDAPSNEVRALIISPSGVHSAKVVS